MRRYLNRSSNCLLLAAAVVLATACNLDVATPTNAPSDPATESSHASLKIDISTMKKTAAGTYYKDVTVGTGGSLTLGLGQAAFLSFVGFLKSGAGVRANAQYADGSQLASAGNARRDGRNERGRRADRRRSVGARLRAGPATGNPAELHARLRRHSEFAAVARRALASSSRSARRFDGTFAVLGATTMKRKLVLAAGRHGAAVRVPRRTNRHHGPRAEADVDARHGQLRTSGIWRRRSSIRSGRGSPERRAGTSARATG